MRAGNLENDHNKGHVTVRYGMVEDNYLIKQHSTTTSEQRRGLEPEMLQFFNIHIVI